MLSNTLNKTLTRSLSNRAALPSTRARRTRPQAPAASLGGAGAHEAIGRLAEVAGQTVGGTTTAAQKAIQAAGDVPNTVAGQGPLQDALATGFLVIFLAICAGLAFGLIWYFYASRDVADVTDANMIMKKQQAKGRK